MDIMKIRIHGVNFREISEYLTTKNPQSQTALAVTLDRSCISVQFDPFDQAPYLKERRIKQRNFVMAAAILLGRHNVAIQENIQNPDIGEISSIIVKGKVSDVRKAIGELDRQMKKTYGNRNALNYRFDEKSLRLA